MKYSKLIYIAGPYRGTVEANVARAKAAAVELWKCGWVVICPHLNTHGFEQYEVDGLTAHTWLEGDLVILSRCDALFMLQGWPNSQGAKVERGNAIVWELPIFYQENGYPNPSELNLDPD